MKKLTVDDLRVESFKTTERQDQSNQLVHAATNSGPVWCISCSGCDTSYCAA